MGAATRARCLAGVAALLGVVWLFPRAQRAEVPEAPRATAVAERAGFGGARDRWLCIGCIGVVVWGGGANPLLMIGFVARYPAFAESCSIACILAAS